MKTVGIVSESRPGMKTLLDVLNGKPLSKLSDEEWTIALALAERERIAPWFVSRLQASGEAFSPPMEAKLQSLQKKFIIATFFWVGELKELLRAFHKEHIPAIPLKGPALAERIYSAAALRTCRDLDLLVRKSDIAKAQELLTSMGFAAEPMGHYHQPFLRGNITVELHKDVVDPRYFDFQIDTAWERAHSATFQGVPVFELSAEDDFLFLALHGVRHEFDSMTLVLDMALAANALPSKMSLNFRPEVEALLGQLLLGYTLARRLLPEICPTLELSVAGSQRPAIESLADQLEIRILTGKVAPLHWRKRNRFHRMLELSTRDKLNRLRIQLQIRSKEIIGISDRDRRFGKKLHLTKTWQLVLIRPLRVILKALGRDDD
jgi:hypothetical protein